MVSQNVTLKISNFLWQPDAHPPSINLSQLFLYLYFQHYLSGKRRLYAHNPFQVWKVTLSLVIRDQIRKSEVIVYTSFKNVLDFNYLNSQLWYLKVRVLFSVCASVHGKWSIPFHLHLYWNVQYLLKMSPFTRKLLKSMKIPFGPKILLKTQVIPCPERPRVLTCHVFWFVVVCFFTHQIGS